jgi:hypothetical protein
MLSKANLVIEALKRSKELDDDELARNTGISPRQTINQICRRLEAKGILVRQKGPHGKIVNILKDEIQRTTAPTTAHKPLESITPPKISEARSNIGNTHISGEMFVAAELAKRGYLVSLTMGNAKAVDLFAERNGRAICVQVKAIAHKRNVGWPLPFDKQKIIAGVIYVCVVLNNLDEAPSYYILFPEEVRELGKWYSTRAILDMAKVRSGGFENAWHKVEFALTAKNILTP